jgi:hypothetical protein
MEGVDLCVSDCIVYILCHVIAADPRWVRCRIENGYLAVPLGGRSPFLHQNTSLRGGAHVGFSTDCRRVAVSGEKLS